MINKHDIKDMCNEGPKYDSRYPDKKYPAHEVYPPNRNTYFGSETVETHHIEKDPNGKDPKQPGAKLDHGKSPLWQGLLDYFPLACKAVADVSAAGAAKYAWKGWESVPDGIARYRNAQARHIVDESIQGVYDPDGFRHLAQNAWNALASLELILREEEQNK